MGEAPTDARKPVRILAVDVGTGTQDVLLFESDRTIENCLQMVMPSPTVIVAERIRRATAAGQPVLLTGRIMGGGPCAWAARDHAQAGYPCFATADAARTLDDDLTQVEALGLHIVSDEEAQQLQARMGEPLVTIEMRDFDAAALQRAFSAFGVDPTVDAVAVAAFDHGAAPPGISDRRFRFGIIADRVRQRPDPLAFAYRAEDVPADLTRLAAVAAEAGAYPIAAQHEQRAGQKLPAFVMDTGAAALAGALEDAQVRGQAEALVANIGNFHTLAFHLRAGRILGLFEHHTGELDLPRLEGYLRELAAGTLDNERIFADSGHGALILAAPHMSAKPHDPLPFLAVTGPRRALLRGSSLAPYEATPHGDMMLAGCFGLLRAVAALAPELAPAIEGVLGQAVSIP
ncbi:MAG: DUF1786 family protein [Ktedonobacterales bacterium]